VENKKTFLRHMLDGFPVVKYFYAKIVAVGIVVQSVGNIYK